MSLTAFRDAQSLGFIRRADVAKLVQRLHRDHFIKSVTSFNDHRQWQDVYNIRHEGVVLYLKFTDHILTEFVLLSFKRK
jgi:motility quorum-sensing regulator/GCU-specific mRNA interferase toxin